MKLGKLINFKSKKSKELKTIETGLSAEEKDKEEYLQNLPNPLKKLFNAVESESSVKEPTCSQWDSFQKQLIDKISSCEDEDFFSFRWITTLKDKVTCTDSPLFKLIFYIIGTAIFVTICLLSYFAFSFFTREQTAQTLSFVAPMKILAFSILNIFI